MKEKEFLKNIFSSLEQGKDIIVGPGDDCAVIDVGRKSNYMLFAVDQLISDIHYSSVNTSPYLIGAKLLKRNISDIAAMGGYPAYALITIASGNIEKKWIDDFYHGLSEEAQKWDMSICGGDIASINKKDITISTLSIAGYVDCKKTCLRGNALSDEAIYVTGNFGESFPTNHHLNFIPRVEEARFLAGNYTNTMIDVSDGLLIDAGRIADNSNVSMKIDTNSIPYRTKTTSLQSALTDGEDYELIFTVKKKDENKLLSEWQFDTGLTKIGTVTERSTSPVIDCNNKDILSKFKSSGYDHLDEDKQ